MRERCQVMRYPFLFALFVSACVFCTSWNAALGAESGSKELLEQEFPEFFSSDFRPSDLMPMKPSTAPVSATITPTNPALPANSPAAAQSVQTPPAAIIRQYVLPAGVQYWQPQASTPQAGAVAPNSQARPAQTYPAGTYYAQPVQYVPVFLMPQMMMQPAPTQAVQQPKPVSGQPAAQATPAPTAAAQPAAAAGTTAGAPAPAAEPAPPQTPGQRIKTFINSLVGTGGLLPGTKSLSTYGPILNILLDQL